MRYLILFVAVVAFVGCKKVNNDQSVSPKSVEKMQRSTGLLEKAVIDKHVRKHLYSIRKCYDKELHNSPDLAGRVVMRFIINTDGTVHEINTSETDLKNENVETCIHGVIKRITFPKPENNGMVIVNYPFRFSQG